MAATLSGCLSEEEISTISETIRDKLSAFFDANERRIDDLRVEKVRLTVQLEQSNFDWETQLKECRAKLDAEIERNKNLFEKNSEFEIRIADYQSKLQKIQEEKFEVSNELIQSEKQREFLQTEKKELVELLEKKNNELDHWNAEWKNLSEKLSESNAENLQYLAKLQDVNARCSTLELREKRLEQERDGALRHLEAVNVELAQKNNEVLEVRKEKYANVLQLQTQLQNVTEELRSVTELRDVLQKTVDEKSEKIDAMIGQIKECNTANVHMEEQYRQELRAQVKLTELYKDAHEQEKSAVAELTTAFQEIQNLYKQTTSDTATLQQEFDATREEMTAELDRKTSQISSLQEELKHANSLLHETKRKILTDEEVEKLSPSAATISRMMKSGISMTQMFNELVTAKDELITKDAENKQLNLYLCEVVQQLEERAPLVKKLRDDYDKAVETIATMKHKSSEAIMDYEKIRVAAEDARFRSCQLEKENKRLQLQVKDLSQQVCMLLRESEEARSGYMSLNVSGGSDQVSSSSQVITQRMVSFRSIEELQKRNCELLAVARELSSKQEEAEAKETETIRAEMETAMRNAFKEIQELKESKERQMTMLESIVRQRDMYRMLLSQSGTVPEQAAVTSSPVVSTSPMISPNVNRAKEHSERNEEKLAMEQLQKEFDNYKFQKKESESILTEQVEKQRADLSSSQLEAAKLKSQVEFAAERYQNLKSNFESYKKEIAALNDKNKRMAAINVKQEHIINTLREEAMTLQRKLSQAEVNLENLKSEHELLRRAEARLQTENENQAQKYLEHNLLAANLQAIQNQLERSQVEMKIRLNSRIELLERECTSLRQKLDRENEHYKEAVKTWETELKRVQAKLDGEMQKEKKTRDELIDSYSIVHGLKQELAEMENKLKAAQSKLDEVRQPSSAPKKSAAGDSTTESEVPSESVQFLRIRMKELQNENNALTEQLKLANNGVEQYKNLAANFENQLQEQCRENKNLYDMMQQKMDEMSAGISNSATVKEECERAKREKSEMEVEIKRVTEESSAKINWLQSELNAARRELESSLQMREEAIRNESAAYKECQDQSYHAKEAQDKYERELMLHAADVKAFTALKTQMETSNGKIAAAEEAARKAEVALKSAKDSWLTQEAQLKKESARLLKKCQELEKQNELLYSEMDKLTSKMVAMQSGDAANRSFGDPEDVEKSSEQLIQVIKYLRREKEMADTKHEVTAAECQRLRLKLEHVEKQLTELRESTGKEERKTEANLATAAQHADLLHKIQMLNVLTDSNRLLREEHSGLEQQNKALDAKVACLEAEIAPLQESNRELAKMRDALTNESQALKAEVKRWQSHAQQLLEQTNKMKPEDYQKALQDKETLQTQVGSLQEEVHRLKAEVSQLNLLKVDVANFTVELQTKTQQMKRNAEELESKDSQLAETAKTILQIKKIGRKYKTQYDELKVQYDQLIAKDDQKEVMAQHEAAVTAAQEAGVIEGRQQMEAKVLEAEDVAKQLRMQIQQKDEELSTFKKSEDNFKMTDEKSRKVLQSARQRIVQLNAQRDEQLRALEELRNRLSTVEQVKEEETLRNTSVKSQYEAQIARLENGLTEARENLAAVRQENEQLHHEVEELSHRIAQMQRSHLGQQSGAKLQSTAGPSREGSILSQSSEMPPTANIKPISTRTDTPASHRPPHPLGVSTTSGTSTRTTPTASIRPITATASSTRMAAVTPTTAAVSITVVHPDTHEGHTPSPPSVPQATVAPTAAVIPVTATVSPTPVVEQVVDVVVDVEDSDGQLQGQDEDVTVPEGSVVEIADEHFASQSGVATAMVNPLVEQGQEDDEVAGTSQDTRQIGHVTVSTGGKRTREDPDSSDNVPAVTLTPIASSTDRPPKKRTRMTAEVTSTSPEKTPSSRGSSRPQAEEVTITVVRSIDEVEVSETSDVYNPVSVSSSGGNQTEQVDSPKADSEIIVVTSDEETQEPIDDEDEERDYREDQYEEEQMQEEEVDVDDKGYDAEEMAEDDEGDVEIIEEDEGEEVEVEEEQQMEEPEEVVEQVAEESVEQAEVTAADATASHARPSCLPRIPVRTERLQSTGRQQQLTPFGSGTGFEDGDSIVPSTPTLFDPRRNDGFAEALSSPQVPQGRFLFGSSQQEAAVPSCHSALSQLASQGALGVDDTRMDLSQFDEGSGRSVPTTPLQVSPPAEAMNAVTSELAAESTVVVVQSDAEEILEVNVTESGGQTLEVPSITVTSEEDAVLGVEEIADDGTVVTEDTTMPVIEEPDIVAEPSTSESDQTIVIVDVTTSASDGASTSRESSATFTVQGVDERDSEGTEHHFGAPFYGQQRWYQDMSGTQRYQQQQHRQQNVQRRPTPIVWNEPSPSRAHGGPMPPLLGPSPSGNLPGPSQGPPAPPAMQRGFGRAMMRMQRGRRIRIAGGMNRGMGGGNQQPGGRRGGSPHPGNVGVGRGERGGFRYTWRGGQPKGRGARTPPRS